MNTSIYSYEGHQHGQYCYWDHLRACWICQIPSIAPRNDLSYDAKTT